MHHLAQSTSAAHDTNMVSIHVRSAYDVAGDGYMRYADGDTSQLFAFDGQHAEADRRIWSAIDAHLLALREAGQHSLRVLDVGCGPGTWLARVIARAATLGFEAIAATGFDLVNGFAETARTALRTVAERHPDVAVEVSITQADACGFLPRLDCRFDLTLCLYSVLSHIGGPQRPGAAAQLARVTRGRLLVSVRAAGSLPTIYIDRLERALHFQQDHARDRMEVDLLDGRHLSMTSHQFRAAEFEALFAAHVRTHTLKGLDLFHARFVPDPRWNPEDIASDERFRQRLDALEDAWSTDPVFIDHATHLLLAAECGDV